MGGEQAESFKGQTATKEIKSKYYLLANQERGKKIDTGECNDVVGDSDTGGK